jgi:hypothetical protein
VFLVYKRCLHQRRRMSQLGASIAAVHGTGLPVSVKREWPQDSSEPPVLKAAEDQTGFFTAAQPKRSEVQTCCSRQVIGNGTVLRHMQSRWKSDKQPLCSMCVDVIQWRRLPCLGSLQARI